MLCALIKRLFSKCLDKHFLYPCICSRLGTFEFFIVCVCVCARALRPSLSMNSYYLIPSDMRRILCGGVMRKMFSFFLLYIRLMWTKRCVATEPASNWFWRQKRSNDFLFALMLFQVMASEKFINLSQIVRYTLTYLWFQCRYIFVLSDIL